MKHLGDIQQLDGSLVEPVDVITFGSPCQDLSVSGKRKGLDGRQSGLFFEAIRIIKQMLEATNGRYPAFVVWENVPGAISSNKGEDFRTVLETFARIKNPTAIIPQPKKWTKAGCVMGDGWSLAWRICDAQFWGVAQRRRRIALVMDIRGESAPEILFERESMCGDITQSRTKGQSTSSYPENSAGTTGFGETGIGYWQQGIQTIRAEGENRPSRPSNVIVSSAFMAGQSAKAGSVGYGEEVSPTLKADAGGNQIPSVCTVRDFSVHDCRGNGNGELCPTLVGAHQARATDFTAVVTESMPDDASQSAILPSQPCASCALMAMQGFGDYKESKCTSALKQRDYKDATDLIVAGVDARNATENDELSPTLQAKNNGGISLNYLPSVRINYRVRRLTPLECERLMDFPDNWTDLGEYIGTNRKVKKVSDSARYRAIGNSIALPPWVFVLSRIALRLRSGATLGSLFDGIGGFPLIWERINGAGSAVWASEIEEFPIAVTKRHFSIRI